MGMIDNLKSLRAHRGTVRTPGLSDEYLERFADDADLQLAVAEATAAHQALSADPAMAPAMKLDEDALCEHVQADYLNFYDAASVNPYIALAARGPWLITSHGAVLHDSGGYGMLGFGHGPQSVLETMHKPWVMANVMTPSLTHLRFAEALKREVGHARGSCPFPKFLAMNSGSESVTVACRISDVLAKQRHGTRTVKFLALKGAFHGRTDRPAQASDSSLPRYRQHLQSFSDLHNLITVPPNDVEALEDAFAKADEDGVYIEMMLMEPVMGEGNPGLAITRAFYDAARRLTLAHGTLLLVDSIQAGLRTTGSLSIVDYPGFEDCEAPDLETYSKALNAGQYPLSILAMSQRAADSFRRGIYGNTMTTNPRALEVATTVLEQVTPALRQNIQDRGVEFLEQLRAVQRAFPELVTKVQGTGLLISCELVPSIAVVGFGGIEEHCRRHGMGVIHGGVNSLRFTPHFAITSKEITLICDVLRDALGAFQIDLGASAVRAPAASLA